MFILHRRSELGVLLISLKVIAGSLYSFFASPVVAVACSMAGKTGMPRAASLTVHIHKTT